MGIVEIDELYEEGDVKQDRLGIGEAQGQRLGEVTLTRVHHRLLSFPLGDKIGVQYLHPQIEQVDGAEVAHQSKQQGRGTDERGHPQVGAEDQDGIADEDAERRPITGTYATARAGTQHIKGVGARRYDDEEETDQIGPDIDDTQTLKHLPPRQQTRTGRQPRRIK